MSKKLNPKGSSHAGSLVSSGKIDNAGSWSAPSADAENRYISEHGLAEWGRWYLGVDPSQDEDNKGRYSYPFSNDFKRISVRGLAAIEQRASQGGHADIKNRAKELFDAAKKKVGDESGMAAWKQWASKFPLVAKADAPRSSPFRYIKAERKKPHQILIYGQIGRDLMGRDGIEAAEFSEMLDKIPDDEAIQLRINSPGGNFYEGLAIYNLARSRGVTTRVDGQAASVAANIFCAGRTREIPDESNIMIHKAWGMCIGNADDMTAMKAELDNVDKLQASILSRATGKTREEIMQRMGEEAEFNGPDARAFGFGIEPQIPPEPPQPSSPVGADEEEARIATAIMALKLSAAQKPAGNRKPSNENTMNKKTIVALLKKHGIEASEDETEEQLNAKLSQIPIQAKEGKDGKDGKEDKEDDEEDDEDDEDDSDDGRAGKKTKAKGFNAKSEIRALRRDSIRANVLRLGENKIENADVDRWVKRAEREGTETVYAEIQKMPELVAAGEPVSFNGIEILDAPPEPGTPFGLTGLRGPQSEALVNIRKEHKTPSARYAALRDNWSSVLPAAIRRDHRAGRGRDIFAANTYSATLVTSFLMEGSLTDLVNLWAFLRAFSRDSSVDPYKPLATGVLKHVTGAEATQTNPTTFEPVQGSTVAPISVTMNWYNQPMRVSATDLNSGLRMDDLRVKNLAAFADAVTQVATTPITAANFATLNPEIVSAAAFNWSNAQNIRAQLKKSPIKNLILDGAYLARLENVPTFFQNAGIGGGERRTFGWDGIYEATNWTGAGNNIQGFGCHPQALVGITGLPLSPPNIPGGVFSTTTFELPGLGIAVALNMWFSLASRTMFVSWDVIAGFATGDLSAGCVLASGTPS